MTNPPAPKKRGRPATGRDELMGLRLPQMMIWRIDAFRANYQDMTRPVAARILLDLGLKTPPSKLPRHGLTDPKNSFGNSTQPRAYTPKPKGEPKAPKPPEPVIEEEAPRPHQADPYGPRRKPHTLSPDAVKAAADRAAQQRK